MRYTFALLCLSIALSLFHAIEARADTPIGGVSWYAETGYNTCSGEYYTGEDYTAAASPAYPIGTVLSVSWGGREVWVRVNDCSPYGSYTWDLSQAAAEDLGFAWTYGRVWPEVYVVAYGDGYDPWSGWCYLYGC